MTAKHRDVVGHFHVPWRPSRLRLLFWRVFAPSKYRSWTQPIQVGSVSMPNFGYSVGPSAFLAESAAMGLEWGDEPTREERPAVQKRGGRYI